MAHVSLPDVAPPSQGKRMSHFSARQSPTHMLKEVMKLHVYTGGVASANSYVLEIGAKELLIVDAAEGVTAWVEKKFPDYSVSHLLITHSHFDHVMDAAKLHQRYQCHIVAHSPFEEDLTLIKGVRSSWGLEIELSPYPVDIVLGKDAHPAQWGGLDWRALPVPGHSVDSTVYYLQEAGLVFTGDTIFAGSVGRTDLPGGDMHQLIKNLRRHVLSLPMETIILPGHGGESTVDAEERNNPFL